ncbi:MAG: PHP domain-containing protein [Deltaproteobacteria bacterium]|nr:PHP domain-containing protein [Deltaproteobacteria bacterium]
MATAWMIAHMPKFFHFRDLTFEAVNRDFQIHTTATDGQATIEEIIEKARSIGLGEIAFTEHVRKTSNYFSDFVAQVKRLRKKTGGIAVYVGLEAKADDFSGNLDVSASALRAAEIVLGSVHRFPAPRGQWIQAKELVYEEAAKRELDLSLGLLKKAPINVLAHPGGMCQRAFGRFPREYFRIMMQAAVERDVAIEINSSYLVDLDDFLSLCKEVNPKISIGSDVHRLSDLGLCRNALRQRGIGCP